MATLTRGLGPVRQAAGRISPVQVVRQSLTIVDTHIDVCTPKGRSRSCLDLYLAGQPQNPEAPHCRPPHRITERTQTKYRQKHLADGIFLASLRPANLGLASLLLFIQRVSFQSLQGLSPFRNFGSPLQRSPVGPTLWGLALCGPGTHVAAEQYCTCFVHT